MIVHVCCKGMLPMFSSVFSRSILQVCLSWCCICFTHMLHVILSGCCLSLHWFSSDFMCFFNVSKTCFKCFICLQTYVAIIAFGCFKNRSCVTSLLLTFCYIVLACPSLGTGKTSIRCHGRVLLNRRRRPFPLLSLEATWIPRGARETKTYADLSSPLFSANGFCGW
jgi:hypothetical protein